MSPRADTQLWAMPTTEHVTWHIFCAVVRPGPSTRPGPTSGSFMRAKVSRGPPRQAAQLGAAGVTQPASSKISAAVLPSQPGTGIVYTSAHTWGVGVKAGTGAGSTQLVILRETRGTPFKWLAM